MKKKNKKTIIKVEKVSKSFQIPKEQKDSLKSYFLNPFRKTDNETFEALKDVNFDIKEGEFVGIIGRNGSGKSTLLKLIAGIYMPNAGKIEVRGKLVPFLELGVGFNPELSGRENVFLNGVILGMSRKFLQEQFDEIIDFAEVREFMDLPLKNYSSGMQVRLAFSIAIQADADIYLLDEILAVGDLSFQKKCMTKMYELGKAGATFIFVSHDMSSIIQYCDMVVLLEAGKVKYFGSTNRGVEKYVHGYISQQSLVKGCSQRKDEKIAYIYKVLITDKKGEECNSFLSGEQLNLKIFINSSIDIKAPNLGFIIYNDKDVYVYGSNTDIAGKKLKSIKKGKNVVKIEFPQIPLLEGKYFFTIAFHDMKYHEYDSKERCISFNVESKKGDLGIVEINYDYK